MILVLNLDLDVMVTYLHTKMMSIGQMVKMLWFRNIGKFVLFDSCDLERVQYLKPGQTDIWADTWTDRQTDRQTYKTFTYPLSQVLIVAFE